MAIENTVSIDFDPRSSIAENVFDCRLPSVDTANNELTTRLKDKLFKTHVIGVFLKL